MAAAGALGAATAGAVGSRVPEERVRVRVLRTASPAVVGASSAYSPPLRLQVSFAAENSRASAAKQCKNYSSPWNALSSGSRGTAVATRCVQTENPLAEADTEESQEVSRTSWNQEATTGDESGDGGDVVAEDFGEVDRILASRVVDRKTQYLIQWKDDHPDSWEPSGNIAKDVTAEYETPWWQAARKVDVDRLTALLEAEDVQRDVNAIDENERTALHFAAGLGSERCVRLLVEYGADVLSQVPSSVPDL